MAQPMRFDDPEPSHHDLDDVLAAMDPSNPEFRARVDASRVEHEAEMRRTGRIPTLAAYRKVYENLHHRHGIEVPSDDEIRRIHLVAP